MLANPKRTHLNRALSKLGICSRRVADGWILAGRIRVNGEVAIAPDFWVEIGTDIIEVDQATLGIPSTDKTPRAHVYLLVHKPAGYVTTRKDELGRKTVYDLLPMEYQSQADSQSKLHADKGKREAWIFPVGRLDLESEGLLLMTDDGEWANLLTDPDFHVEKTYRVKLDRQPLPDQLEQFRTGILLEGRVTLPAKVEAEGQGWHRVVIHEGRNRQIRRMFHALGYKVKRLVRVSIGTLELGDLKPGEVRNLEPEWVERLRLESGL
jgi:23S rRNA pseudouridine2605 synthase